MKENERAEGKGTMKLRINGNSGRILRWTARGSSEKIWKSDEKVRKIRISKCPKSKK